MPVNISYKSVEHYCMLLLLLAEQGTRQYLSSRQRQHDNVKQLHLHKNTNNVKVLVSKWISQNEYRHNAIINILWPKNMVRSSQPCCRLPSSGYYTVHCTVYSSIELSDVQLALQNWRKEQKTPNMEHSENRDSRDSKAVQGNVFINIVSTF